MCLIDKGTEASQKNKVTGDKTCHFYSFFTHMKGSFKIFREMEGAGIYHKNSTPTNPASYLIRPQSYHGHDACHAIKVNVSLFC